MATITRLLTPLVLALVCFTSMSSTTRLELSQRQACYHQPYNRQLVCQCSNQANYLNLRLSEFVVRARQEVSSSSSSSQVSGVSSHSQCRLKI